MSAMRDWTENERLLNTAIHAESCQDKIAARVLIIQQLNERERLREALRQVRAMFFEHAQAGAEVVKGKLIPLDKEQHPWIPGAEAPRAIAVIDAALSDQNG